VRTLPVMPASDLGRFAGIFFNPNPTVIYNLSDDALKAINGEKQ